MKWKKFTLTTTTEAVDLVSSMLDDVGIEGIEVEDNVPLTEKETKGMFIDILPELPPDEGVAKVSFYLDDDDQVEEMLRRVNEGLDELAAYTELGQRTIEASETEDKDCLVFGKVFCCSCLGNKIVCHGPLINCDLPLIFCHSPYHVVGTFDGTVIFFYSGTYFVIV